MSDTTISGLDPKDYTLPERYRGSQTTALIVGVVGLLICAGGFFLDSEQLFRSWLIGWIFWLIIGLGCLGWLMINHLTAGSWGIVMRRSWEAGARTIPFLAILALPFLAGMDAIFSWAQPETVAESPVIQEKTAYLSVGFFWIRFAIYFAVLTALAFLLSRKSAQQDETGSAAVSRSMRNISGPGIVLYVLSISVLCWDWLMSLAPEWFSSLYGMYFVTMTALSSLAFTCILAWSLNKQDPMKAIFRTKYFHDKGKLCLALVMFWAYMTLSQFLITWSGNVPEFASWYYYRNTGGWKIWSILLVIFHFFVPFAILLSAALKKQPGKLAALALFLLAMQWFDLYWQAAPSWYHHVTVHWLDFAALAAIGGLWLSLFFQQLRSRTLMPINDPFIPEVIPHES